MPHLPISRRQQLPWVILRLGKHHLALSALYVREMVAMPEVTEMPGVGPHLRGMINLRGEVLPLLDLRRRLGLPSLSQEAGEIEASLAQQETEHCQWLAELEAAVSEARRFTLPTDPDQCAFGRWYRGFTADDPFFITLLASLDQPHRQTHQVGRKVAELLEQGLQKQAQDLMERVQKGVLARLLKRLAATRQALNSHEQREIAVVVDSPGRHSLALAVDEVEAVEELLTGGGSLDEAEAGPMNHKLLAGIGQRLPSREMVFLLDLERLLAEGRQLARQAGQAD
jgi:chemotaxis signal transduction protein